MTILVLLVALFVAVILTEIGLCFFGREWFREQTRKITMHLKDFRAANSDDDRQQLLLRSGWETIRFGIVTLCLVGCLFLIVFLPLWILTWVNKQQTTYLLTMSIAATVWVIFRSHQNPATIRSDSKTVNRSSYRFLDRWLHWLALEPTVVRRLAFDLDRLYSLPANKSKDKSYHGISTDPADGAVYVCGLARSGTTMLLRLLDQVDVFRSLNYRDMPFVMAPNLWKRIAAHAQKEMSCTERAHGDGIFVDYDSPEAFEEVFWRTFNYTQDDAKCFGSTTVSLEALAAFNDYRMLVANPKKRLMDKTVPLKRYLSKNNNNLLRLQYLSADPTATLFVVYRHPVATARSLYRQHKRFCAMQTEDTFTLHYMRWLAHHEFGLIHRPFCFAVNKMVTTCTPDNPNYWLDYWNAVYSHVLEQIDLPVCFVDHDAMCAEPQQMLESIFNVLGVEVDIPPLARQIIPPRLELSPDGEFCADMLSRTERTYRELLTSPKNVFKINR